MTVDTAIVALDSLTPNSYDSKIKLSWLERVEASLAQEIFHTSAAALELATELMAKAPFDELYIRYMQCQIFLEAGEITRYNNAMALYNNALAGLRRDRIRSHMSDHPRLTGF